METLGHQQPPMSMEMLGDIRDESQYHPDGIRRHARYKICDHIKQIKLEWEGALQATQNMGKGLHKVFKNFVNIFRKIYHLWVNLVQKFPISFQDPETLLKLPNCQMT